MNDVTLVGIDLGKHSFHLHGQDRRGRAVFRKKLTRKQLMLFFSNFPRCTVVMEACAGAHYIARKLSGFGHEVKLISPHYVKPFVKGNKNDFIDAEAVCEAASRPSMRFVTPKSEAQQTLSALHRVRDALVKQRTATINQIHGFLLEFGISLPVGREAIKSLPSLIVQHSLPVRFTDLLQRLLAHFKYLDEQVQSIEKELRIELADDERGQRLLTIPGIGPITASVLAAELGDAHQFGCAREFAASIGLVPRQYSTGGKANLLGISKRGDSTLRRLLVQCARVIMQHLDNRRDRLGDWLRSMLIRRHPNVVACALANKLARIAWAMMAHDEPYRPVLVQHP
ncbi:IS110 family RNA-guided transposase [Caballeronia grimmiae]|uniref:IS110 family transposase n=1 Tax=Caballeronia grimmiae TaxID=1071679 RepID=UPI0038B8E7D5